MNQYMNPYDGAKEEDSGWSKYIMPAVLGAAALGGGVYAWKKYPAIKSWLTGTEPNAASGFTPMSDEDWKTAFDKSLIARAVGNKNISSVMMQKIHKASDGKPIVLATPPEGAPITLSPVQVHRAMTSAFSVNPHSQARLLNTWGTNTIHPETAHTIRKGVDKLFASSETGIDDPVSHTAMLQYFSNLAKHGGLDPSIKADPKALSMLHRIFQDVLLHAWEHS